MKTLLTLDLIKSPVIVASRTQIFFSNRSARNNLGIKVGSNLETVPNLTSLIGKAYRTKKSAIEEIVVKNNVTYQADASIADLLDKKLCLIIFNDITRLKKAIYQEQIFKKDAATLSILYQYRVEQRTRKLLDEVAERKKVEADIKRTRNLYKTMVENFPNGSITLYDKNINVLFTDGSIFSERNINRDLYLGKNIKDFMEEPVYRQMYPFYKKCLKGKKLDTILKIGDNYYAINAVPVKDENQKISGCLSFARDITVSRKNELLMQDFNKQLKKEITERKGAEKALRILSNHLIHAQENERRRISFELHDSINQLLSAVKLRLHAAEANAETGNQTTKEIIDAKRILETAITEIRAITKNLRPIPLEDTGLAPAIDALINDFHERSKIKVSSSIKLSDKRLKPEVELTIYRIIQEALHNIEKHSKANSANVLLTTENETVYLDIRDDGKGFPAQNIKSYFLNKSRMGLLGMKERVQLLNGEFKIESQKERGSHIQISLPAN